MSETRPRRATIMASLTAVVAGAAIAGTATLLNKSDEAEALSVPMVAGYDGTNNKARQNSGEPTVTATALSGSPQSANPSQSSTTTSSSTTSSSSTTPTSTSSKAPEPPAPPPPSSTTQQPSKQAPAGHPNPALAARVVELTNQVRSCATPLKVDSRITTAAQKHASDMALQNYFSHDSKDGRTFDKRIRAEGYDSPGAENIAQGQKTAEQVMKAWMESPGHMRNIINCDYTAIGVAVDTEGNYWVQDFGF